MSGKVFWPAEEGDPPEDGQVSAYDIHIRDVHVYVYLGIGQITFWSQKFQNKMALSGP